MFVGVRISVRPEVWNRQCHMFTSMGIELAIQDLITGGRPTSDAVVVAAAADFAAVGDFTAL